ncbi:dolichol-phosphate mannosyltransferase subunit 3 [Cimex lectularius]|uniref:Dolichol-phosphate mannosyltransferase subunit 3 n=1 Tax=Cimex lectularius TaxID=79782 RepID=A0A8I6RET1_CIMLE|nr:dolichol-phosphate mannosyltransferase subunit 3 [Cimex lectularius]
MTKLAEWLTVLVFLLSTWFTLLSYKEKSHFVDEWYTLILYSPVILVFSLGVYALSSVLWGVLTFNDCPDAAEELQRQIKEAKEDLRKKGLKN